MRLHFNIGYQTASRVCEPGKEYDVDDVEALPLLQSGIAWEVSGKVAAKVVADKDSAPVKADKNHSPVKADKLASEKL